MQHNTPIHPQRYVVYKTRSGRTLLARTPFYAPKRVPADSQRSVQAWVRQAVTYAEFAQDQPIYQSRSLGRSHTAYHLAISDALLSPKILDVDISRWTWGVGQEICIRARDNFMVLSVRLAIRDREFVWEEGEAVQSESDILMWTYTTRTPVAREPGIRLDAYACDLPGNVGEFHLELR